MIATQVRRIPLITSAFVVLIITLLLCLALLRFSGTLSLGSSVIIDPNGGSCQHRAGGLLASGVSIDGNGAS